MTFAQFVAKVSEMRNAQRSYFRTRDRAFLEKSKTLEKEVDKAVEVFYDPQGDLFEGGAE